MIYEFQATQDLHGYAKPWAPGAGKNIYDVSIPFDGKIDSNGIVQCTGVQATQSSFPLPDEYAEKELTYSAYIKIAGAGSSNLRVMAQKGASNYQGNHVNSNVFALSKVTFTPPETGYILKFNAGQGSGPIEIDKIQCEAGDSVTSWEPYSNICMPEGFNIWNPYNDEFIQVYAGYVNANTRELYLRPVYQEYAGEELVGPWMSSLDPYAEDTTPTEGAFVIDFGGELTSLEITPFMLQTLLDSLGIRQHFTDGAGLLNSLMDQAQGRVRSEEELLHLSRPLKVIAIGDQLPAGLTFKPISKDVLPGLPGKFIR